MKRLFTRSSEKTEQDLEVAMRKVSLLVAVIALVLMVGGMLDMMIPGLTPGIPGDKVVPLLRFLHPLGIPAGLLAMSAGLVLLCALPAVRVALALGIYLGRRNLLDAAAAVLILMELLFSVLSGIGK